MKAEGQMMVKTMGAMLLAGAAVVAGCGSDAEKKAEGADAAAPVIDAESK